MHDHLNAEPGDSDGLLLAEIHQRLPELRKLLEKADGHWGAEDGFYRFYHQSFKVYPLKGDSR